MNDEQHVTTKYNYRSKLTMLELFGISLTYDKLLDVFQINVTPSLTHSLFFSIQIHFLYLLEKQVLSGHCIR